jgi:hypothetical protein
MPVPIEECVEFKNGDVALWVNDDGSVTLGFFEIAKRGSRVWVGDVYKEAPARSERILGANRETLHPDAGLLVGTTFPSLSAAQQVLGQYCLNQ